MKHRFAILFTTLALIAGGSPHASAQSSPFTRSTIPTGVSVVAGATTNTTTVVGTKTTLRQVGLAILPQFQLTSVAGTSTVGFDFQLSADGTNWTTGFPLSTTLAANGTTKVRGYAVFSLETSTPIGHCRFIRLARVRNPNAGQVTNLVLNTSYFNQ